MTDDDMKAVMRAIILLAENSTILANDLSWLCDRVEERLDDEPESEGEGP